MPDKNSQAKLSGELESVIERKVGEAFKKRLSELQGKVRWFLYGLGLLVIVLIANGLMSRHSLIALIHDQVFGFEETLDEAMREHVAVSYNNHFWLGVKEGFDQIQSISFYASKAQTVEAMVHILHSGTGRLLKINIRLDDTTEPIWDGTNDLAYARLSLSESIRNTLHQMDRPQNVHELRFEIEDVGERTNDRVFVRSLINVYGREINPK